MFFNLTALFMPLMTFINDLMAVFASNWVVNQVFAFLSYSITELIRFGNLTEAWQRLHGFGQSRQRCQRRFPKPNQVAVRNLPIPPATRRFPETTGWRSYLLVRCSLPRKEAAGLASVPEETSGTMADSSPVKSGSTVVGSADAESIPGAAQFQIPSSNMSEAGYSESSLQSEYFLNRGQVLTKAEALSAKQQVNKRVLFTEC